MTPPSFSKPNDIAYSAIHFALTRVHIVHTMVGINPRPGGGLSHLRHGKGSICPHLIRK